MEEIQRADPRARRWAVVLVALGTVGGLVLIRLAESQRPVLEAWITSDPTEVDTRLRLIASGFGLAFGVPTLLGAGFLWRLGGRIVSFNRFPPPGMRVIRDTVVLSGQAARWRGHVLQLLALILTLAAVGFGIMVWRLVSLFESRAA
jgi:hypothetical protein